MEKGVVFKKIKKNMLKNTREHGVTNCLLQYF